MKRMGRSVVVKWKYRCQHKRRADYKPLNLEATRALNWQGGPWAVAVSHGVREVLGQQGGGVGMTERIEPFGKTTTVSTMRNCVICGWAFKVDVESDLFGPIHFVRKRCPDCDKVEA